jgi:hypothetical protein
MMSAVCCPAATGVWALHDPVDGVQTIDDGSCGTVHGRPSVWHSRLYGKGGVCVLQETARPSMVELVTPSDCNWSCAARSAGPPRFTAGLKSRQVLVIRLGSMQTRSTEQTFWLVSQPPFRMFWQLPPLHT